MLSCRGANPNPIPVAQGGELHIDQPAGYIHARLFFQLAEKFDYRAYVAYAGVSYIQHRLAGTLVFGFNYVQHQAKFIQAAKRVAVAGKQSFQRFPFGPVFARRFTIYAVECFLDEVGRNRHSAVCRLFREYGEYIDYHVLEPYERGKHNDARKYQATRACQQDAGD